MQQIVVLTAEESEEIVRAAAQQPTPDVASDEVRHPIALEAICGENWLITPEALAMIISVARTGSGPPYRERAGGLFDELGIEGRAAPAVRNRTAVISLDGPVFPKGNLLTRSSGATSLRALQQEFAAALADDGVERIVLAIDSPGGVATGIQAFAQQIFEARGKKPITAVAQDMAASAALWIASAADEFVVTPTARVGSIGVVLTARKSDADAREVQIVSSQSPLKRQDPASTEGRQTLQAWADTTAQVFIDDVARNRGVDSKTVAEKFGRGGMLSAAEAVAVGMADRVGTIEQIIAGIAGTTPRSNDMTQANAPAITRETIAAEHPAIAEAFRTEGAQKERDRIKAVQEHAMPGHEALIQTLMFDGKTSGDSAAAQVVRAEKAARGTALEARRNDAPNPLPPARQPDQAPSKPVIDPSLPIAERCKVEWQHDADLRAEFLSVEDYIAFSKAQEGGRVRILRGKQDTE